MAKTNPEDDLEIAPSHQALSVVAGWLGMSAEDALEETGAAAEELFEKPRPNLLGLGAKYLSHSKAIETASALDNRLKRRIDRSMPDEPSTKQHKHHHHQQQQQALGGRAGAKAAHGSRGLRGGRDDDNSSSNSSSDDDEDGGGKLSALTRGSGGAGSSGRSGGKGQIMQTQAARPLTAEERRRQLLAAPAAELSKWQRKRLRQKEKRVGAGGGPGMS